MQLQDGEIIVFVACFSCDSYTHGEAHRTEHDEVVSPHICPNQVSDKIHAVLLANQTIVFMGLLACMAIAN